MWFISRTFEEQINILNKTCVSKLFTSVVVKGDIFQIITLLFYVVGSSCGSRPKPLFTEFVWEVFRLNSDGSKSQKNGTLLLAVPLEASHWLSQYPTDFGEWNEDTFIPKHSSGGLWKCLSTVREASGVTRYGKLGWHWRPRRVPNQSCYGYHQISHKGDTMEIFVIAPYASGCLLRLLTFIYWSLLNF